MLDVGLSEILLTSAIALIVLGPERLPKVARQVGNWMGRARAMARQLSEQLEREVSAEELLKTQAKPSSGSSAKGAISPHSAAAFDTSYTPPGVGVAAPEAAALPSTAAVEPVYGQAAGSTTPAAMHANDPPAALPITDPHESAADANSRQ
jgi:sec-independent protein translocase protein TatB